MGAAAMDMSRWARCQPRPGAHFAGRYEDPDGGVWWIKEQRTDNHARNEVLASSLYTLAGVPVPQVELVRLPDGGAGTASAGVVGGRVISDWRAEEAATRTAFANGFAADAWLANWDVASSGNALVIDQRKVVRVDLGGALEFRALGERKGAAFASNVVEVDTLLDPSANSVAAEVFGDVPSQSLTVGAGRIEILAADDLHAVVSAAGYARPSRRALVKLLIERAAGIAAWARPAS